MPALVTLLLLPAAWAKIAANTLQNCTCYNSYNLVRVNGTPICQPSTVPGHASISITVLVVVPALVIVFLLLDALGRLRRGSYERYMLRWVRRRGPPGE